MFSVSSFLPSIPGPDDVRALARRVDTARHHGVPSGCILELDLPAVPAETSGFDPLAMLSAVTGASRPLLLRETVAAIHRAADDPRVAGLIARVQIPAAPPGPVQELREAIVAFTARSRRWRGPRPTPARCPTTWPRRSARCGCSRPARSG